MTTSRWLTENRGRSRIQLHTYYLVTPVFWRAEISDLWQQVKMTKVASRFVEKLAIYEYFRLTWSTVLPEDSF